MDTIIENREKEEKLMRERSIRTNRKHKFVECLCTGDVNIGTNTGLWRFLSHIKLSAELRKLAWAGIPDELRPVAWQLLLVCLLQQVWCDHHSVSICRVTSPYIPNQDRQLWQGNVESISPLLNWLLPETRKDWTSKYGIKSKLMSHVHDLASNCGCTVPRSG